MSFIRGMQKIGMYIKQYSSYNASRHVRHDYENVFLRAQKDVISVIKCPLTEASILVLGCGYHYPDVILFSRVSKCTVGLDVLGAFYRDGIARAFHDVRNRTGSTLGALFRAIMLRHYYIYHHYFQKISGEPIEHQKYNLLSYGGCQMPFEDETFDVVLSNQVLEHVEDLEGVFKELHRITKKQGISYHFWHNYYSFSGGHVPEALCLKYPWGHLRGKYETSGLNRLTPTEVYDSFSGCFDIEAFYQTDKNHRKRGYDSDFQFEEEALLSEGLRKELQAWPIELLLTRSYLIVGRK